VNTSVWKRYSSLPSVPRCSIFFKVRSCWLITLLQREAFGCRSVGYNGGMIMTSGKRKYSERNLSQYHLVRADEPAAGVPKTARGKISLARGIQCCPNFYISFTRPASLYCEEYVYIYTYLTIYELPLLANNTAVKHSYINRSGVKCWLDIYRWGGAGLAVTGRIRDIGQTVYSIHFKQDAVAAQLLPNFLPYRIPGGGLY